jgi:hypothetical protein
MTPPLDPSRILNPLFFDESSHIAPISPRQFSLRVVDAIYACQMNSVWHSRLPNIHWSNVVRSRVSVCFGVYHEDVCYAVAIWSDPVAAHTMKEGKTALELRRMAISEDSPANTASWMIARMVDHIRKTYPHLSLLVSYQDTAVHRGTIYKASNWTQAGTTQGGGNWQQGRERNALQADSIKVRWELRLRPAPSLRALDAGPGAEA